MAFLMPIMAGLGGAGQIFTAVKDLVIAGILIALALWFVHSQNEATAARQAEDNAIIAKFQAITTQQTQTIVLREAAQEQAAQAAVTEATHEIATAPAPAYVDLPIPGSILDPLDRGLCGLDLYRATCGGAQLSDGPGAPAAAAASAEAVNGDDMARPFDPVRITVGPTR